MGKIRHHLTLLLVTTVLLLVGRSSSHACQICVPIPKNSAADYLLDAKTVVLARENPDAPFSYAPVDVLKGKAGGKIELFLNSATRRMLAAHPGRSVVIVDLGAGEEREWKRIGIADGQFDRVVRDVLALESVWKAFPRKRVEYFGKLLGQKDSQIGQLAHLEVGKAPYDEIRRLGDAVSREELRAFLANTRYLEWHPLYILLLAQNPEPADRETITNSFRAASRFGTSKLLAAWATAYIELEKAKAIEEIESRFFATPGQTESQLKQLAMALSVHGSRGHTELRDQIVASYGTLLENYPTLTPQVVKDLIAWKRTELGEHVASFAATNKRSLDFQTTLRLRAYAKQGTHQGQ